MSNITTYCSIHNTRSTTEQWRLGNSITACCRKCIDFRIRHFNHDVIARATSVKRSQYHPHPIGCISTPRKWGMNAYTQTHKHTMRMLTVHFRSPVLAISQLLYILEQRGAVYSWCCWCFCRSLCVVIHLGVAECWCANTIQIRCEAIVNGHSPNEQNGFFISIVIPAHLLYCVVGFLWRHIQEHFLCLAEFGGFLVEFLFVVLDVADAIGAKFLQRHDNLVVGPFQLRMSGNELFFKLFIFIHSADHFF